MKIAYLHYHLKTGGVTTVLKQQLSAIGRQTEQLVITGQTPQTPLDAATVHIPELGYSSDYNGTFKPVDAARAIIKAIRCKFKGPCDILHVHNPTLAKNRHFLAILKLLQQEGLSLLLQIHDFAEDGRPLAYYSDPYPADCHYGVINQRDYQILLKSGLKQDGLHLMENTVTIPNIAKKPEIEDGTAVYPIRAIRRKNVGEAILLSLFLEAGQTVQITLPPNSPADIKSYRAWKNFVRDQNLNVAFDQGLSHDFEALVLSAGLLISTSITEGFGFSFLEPWLFGKLLWGRKLADICRDFESNGIRLDHLYTGLYVPIDWIGLRQFRDKWHDCVLKTCALFNFSIENARLRDAFDHITSDGVVDFGLLDESSQKRVMLRLIPRGRDSARLIQINPFLAAPGTVSDKNGLIANNKLAILRAYNPSAYTKKLMNVYQKVSTIPIKQNIDKNVLVSSFFNLEKFSLLKWRDYEEEK
ncbi:Mannosylglucosyl-3-phosphoglycerate synthase (EC [Olavius sp. associated proteobacterium Delta 1]|nr:Mannosylglucosyl-3-phosphoglycerate synthase (EC [Olavius sp. associated proteobacterium Delta 1]